MNVADFHINIYIGGGTGGPMCLGPLLLFLGEPGPPTFLPKYCKFK